VTAKRCTLACDTAQGVRICELELAATATVAEALAAARAWLVEQAADWEHAAVGVYGRVCSREYVPADGERIELYRPLQVDPRAGRRARAASAGKRRP
jgi:putative ubiquitin-RnfH superfamily antitoxin RatB of RatAB toxin-antitoxin module